MIIRSLLFLTGIITVSSFSIVTVAPRTASIVPNASTGPASFRSSRTLLFVEESKESTSADAGADVSADEGVAETSAKEEEEGEAAPEDDKGAGATSAPAAADDILNSPAFLSKKLDVIKADIAKIEEEIGEAKQKLEVEMAEWKPQLDALDNEVWSLLEVAFSNVLETMFLCLTLSFSRIPHAYLLAVFHSFLPCFLPPFLPCSTRTCKAVYRSNRAIQVCKQSLM